MNDISPSPADRLTIDVETAESGATCFVLSGELDPHTAPMLQARIDDEAGDSTSIVLDLADVGPPACVSSPTPTGASPPTTAPSWSAHHHRVCRSCSV